jgi:hypothetical protein
MVVILNFKKGATIVKSNSAVSILDVQGMLMSHYGRDNIR